MGHFAWIKNLSRLVSTQLSKHNSRKYFCDRCMHYFGSAEKLDTHTIDCREINNCAILLPSQDSKWLSFDNRGRKERLPFVIYADLECVLQKTVDTQKDAENRKLCMYQKHEVHSIGYYIHCSYDASLSTYRCHRDADCVSWFVKELKNFANFVKPILAKNTPMLDLTTEQLSIYESAIIAIYQGSLEAQHIQSAI
ncbi:uncharacterized protein LOC122404213 [Colletes gigas]|uniref:uncharacterized protein LOC122404213 n=1 Tax=Colletes gigas TaxID=935657 RepID=UPI001C9AAF39|nr:uncharacterized protein LOC122404213 [Colletes gigas]